MTWFGGENQPLGKKKEKIGGKKMKMVEKGYGDYFTNVLIKEVKMITRVLSGYRLHFVTCGPVFHMKKKL